MINRTPNGRCRSSVRKEAKTGNDRRGRTGVAEGMVIVGSIIRPNRKGQLRRGGREDPVIQNGAPPPIRGLQRGDVLKAGTGAYGFPVALSALKGGRGPRKKATAELANYETAAPRIEKSWMERLLRGVERHLAKRKHHKRREEESRQTVSQIQNSKRKEHQPNDPKTHPKPQKEEKKHP